MLTPKDKLKIFKSKVKKAFTLEPKDQRQKNKEEKQKSKELQKEHQAYLKSINEDFGLEKKKKGGNWIQGAIKKKGSLTATAKSAGAVDKKGKIKKSWLKEKAKGSGKTAQRARLAITLGKLRKKK